MMNLGSIQKAEGGHQGLFRLGCMGCLVLKFNRDSEFHSLYNISGRVIFNLVQVQNEN